MKGRLFLTPALALALAAASLVAASAQDVPRVTVDELKTLVARGEALVLDVRGDADTKIKGALHVPLDQVEARAGELPAGREIVTYCA